MSKFFEFRQNNSGGSFDINDADGIGPGVWIEAENADHANYRAQSIGIYFNGVDDGVDCECCGDRWSSCWGDDEGKDEPTISPKYDFGWHHTVFVHGLDGSIRRIRKDEVQP